MWMGIWKLGKHAFALFALECRPSAARVKGENVWLCCHPVRLLSHSHPHAATGCMVSFHEEASYAWAHAGASPVQSHSFADRPASVCVRVHVALGRASMAAARVCGWMVHAVRCNVSEALMSCALSGF